MTEQHGHPRVVLICHEDDKIDSEGIAAWLANSLNLVGIIKVREKPMRLMTKLRREKRRVGLLRLIDVIAFRVYYALRLARHDYVWIEQTVNRLRSTYPADLKGITTLTVDDPNARAVKHFLKNLKTNLLIARCKFILKPEIFNAPTHGTYVLHPGICPAYRNAHGCFWALANRDVERVGMTLLRVDKGVDTGPVLMQATCKFDEGKESHIVIQYRVVLDNLTEIADKLLSAWHGTAEPIQVASKDSAAWGQPWFTAYLRWKRQAQSSAR
ncbi:MAG: formyltransferase family protein [Gammaproteobacteria bacterium]